MSGPGREHAASLEVLGGRLESVWFGPPPAEAPTLVFLHHGIGSVSTWRDFPAELASRTGFGALVFSRFGYGASDPCPLPRPVRFMHDEALDVLPRVLEVAGVRDCVLVGHSDGASIALIYAGATGAPGVRGLALLAPHVFWEEETSRSIRADLEAFEQGGDLRRKLERHHGANLEAAFPAWADVWLRPEFRDWNLEAFLPGVKVPTLVVQGEDDEYGTRAQVEAIERGIPGRVEVRMLAGVGHSPHRDAPELVREELARFVERE